MTSTLPSSRAAGRLLAMLMCLLFVSAAEPASATEGSPRSPVGGPMLGSSGVVASLPPTAQALPKLTAKSFLLADLTTGEVLAAKNPHGRLRPASAIKILTALTLLPRLDPAYVYKATFDDANVEGSKVGIVPNGTYTVHNLFEGMFLVSGNDASRALAGAGGGLATTVRHMNETARSLGAFDTSARNASGLDEPGQYSSAYDLALLTRAAMQRADFRRYVRTVKSSFPGKMPAPGKTRRSFEIYTQNKLVLNYPGAIGVKTGWTTQARGTFIGAATRNGRTLVATVMNTGAGAWREAAALLDWGFANAAVARPVGTLDAIPLAKTGSVKGEKKASTPVAASTEGRSLPRWLTWPVIVLLGLVAALRTRVLVKRTLRRRRRNANLRLARRLHAHGVTVSRPVDHLLLPPHAARPGGERVGRSA